MNATASGHGSEGQGPGFVAAFALVALASLTVGQLLKAKLAFPLLTGFLLTGIASGAGPTTWREGERERVRVCV
jgi:hypothetical protein